MEEDFSKRADWKRWLKPVAIIIGFVCLGLVLYCGYLAFRIEKRFSGRRWSIPSRVFSDTTILYPGLNVNRALFDEKLHHMGYREVNHWPERKGERRTSASGMELFLHDLKTPSLSREGFPVRLAFWQSRIESITRLDNGESMPILELEPEETMLFFGPEREQRHLISIDQIPEHLIHAVLAAEDKRFYTHHGLDPRGILRAFYTNIRHGAIRQGGSTITQQLAKCYFLTPKRTLSRKLMARIFSCVIVVVPTGLAAADEQSGVKGDPEGWEQVDINGDGFIDANEAQVIADNATRQQAASVKPITARQIFDFMDTNRDGKISKAEWAALIAFQVNSQKAGSKERKAAERIVSAMDANKDGKISKGEVSALFKPYFEQIDTNGDGFIDANEAWGMAYTANSQRLQGPVTAEQIVGYMDKNGDGKISKDEASEELKPHFEQIDANKDGVIDIKEAQMMADYVNDLEGQVTAEQ